MSPLFACFPVCLTFIAIGILALLVFATGMVGPGAVAGGNETEAAAPGPVYGATGPPAWWVVLLIFLGVLLAFLSLDWIGADWQPRGR